MRFMSEQESLVDDFVKEILHLGAMSQHVDSNDAKASMAYWLDCLSGSALSHCLPVDKVRQVKHKSDRSHFGFDFTSSRGEAIKHWCTQHDIAPFTLLQGIFALLVARYSNVADVVMGSKVSVINADQGITLDATDTTADVRFVQRFDVAANPEFGEFLCTNQQKLGEAFSHRQVDLAQVVKALQIRQGDSEQPLYQLKFHYQKQVAQDISAIASECLATADQLKLDLELMVADSAEHMALHWFYNANLFNQSSIVQLNESFNLLLDGVMCDEQSRVYQLPMISSELRQKLLGHEVSAEQRSVPSAAQLFEAQVKQTPENVAIWIDGGQISYRTLNAHANAIALSLQQAGAHSGTLIGVCVERSGSLLAALIAIFKLNAVYVPLDPAYPSARLSFMLEDAEVAILLTGQSEGHLLPQTQVPRLNLSEIVFDSEEHAGCFEASALQSGADNAYVIYTSGSTGQPKGVLGTQQSLTNRLNWLQRSYPASGDDVFCARTTISFVDHIAELFQPLICGASIVVLSETQSSDPVALAAQIDKYNINRLTMVPSLLQQLLENKQPQSLTSLKLVLSSGEPLKFNLVELFHQIYGKEAILLNLYGSTEMGADVSCYESSDEQQNHILRYFDKESEPVVKDPNEVDGIFAQLQDLSDVAGDKVFTQPNVPLDQLLDKFKQTAIPKRSMKLNGYLALLREDVLPYIIDVSQQKYIGHMTSALPNFIPQFSRLIAKYNQNIVKIETSKSLTLIERQVLAMIHRLFYDLPEAHYQKSIQDPMSLHGIITSGGSLANITSLFCARNKGLIAQGATNEQIRDMGANAVMNRLGYTDAVILVSRLAHYSVKKAAALLGIGLNGLIIIEQDEQQRVKTEVLRQKIAECRAQKRFIIAIIGIAGATETGTIDPLPDMADIAEEHNVHFHVDAAWGGAFMFCDSYKHKLRGIERADSITFCAHKQLYLAQGISLCVFKDPKSIFAITTHADYQAALGSFDLGQFTLEGSRPASSLQLHASLHLLAKDGYAWLIKRSMEKTAYFRQLLQSCDAFELVGDNDLNIINYRYIPFELRNVEARYCEVYDDRQNQIISAAVDEIQKRQFAEGKTFVSQTKILHKSFSNNKITVFRVVLSNPKTTPEDLFDVLQDQLRLASQYIENQPNPLLLSTRAADIAIAQSGRYTTPIGKPIDGVQVFILDPYMNLVPDGVTGEVYVAGVCLSNGYLNQPQLTQQCFIDNPFGAGRLYKSGDLARRLKDGNIEFVGRQDHQVKIHGLRVELSEIELMLSRLSTVHQAVVLARRDFHQDEYLVAYIVAAKAYIDEDDAQLLDSIRAEMVKRLPDYMIPKSFKRLATLPLTANGKTDYKQLAAMA